MKILLTGASGFLGSALARRWVDDGHALVALVRPGSSFERLATVRDRLEVVVAHSDEAVIGHVGRTRPDAIVHTACAYGRVGETQLDAFDANVRLGLVLLEGVARAGALADLSFVNTGTVLDASVSPYALAKHQFSAWGRLVAGGDPPPFRFLNVRLQHMYGPGDSASKFTTHVIRACREGRPELELTPGEQRRDFVYIDDVVSAYDTLLRHAGRFDGFADIEIGSGEAPTVRHFVETVHRMTGSRTRLRFGALAYRPHEAMHCRADLTRMSSLGWAPAFSLESGIQRTLERETIS